MLRGSRQLVAYLLRGSYEELVPVEFGLYCVARHRGKGQIPLRYSRRPGRRPGRRPACACRRPVESWSKASREPVLDLCMLLSRVYVRHDLETQPTFLIMDNKDAAIVARTSLITTNLSAATTLTVTKKRRRHSAWQPMISQPTGQ